MGGSTVFWFTNGNLVSVKVKVGSPTLNIVHYCHSLLPLTDTEFVYKTLDIFYKQSDLDVRTVADLGFVA